MKRSETFKLGDTQLNNEEMELFEQKILLRSVCETIIPKLIAQDVPLLSSLLTGVFPGSSIPVIEEKDLRKTLDMVCKVWNFKPNEKFISKTL